MSKGPLSGKRFAFALRIMKLARRSHNEQWEFAPSCQILRCGSAIGTLIQEAVEGSLDGAELQATRGAIARLVDEFSDRNMLMLN